MKYGVGKYDTDKCKEVEAAFAEKEIQYRSIFESVADGIIIFDHEGRIVDANPAACNLHGYSREEFIRLTGRDVVHPDYYYLFEEFIRETTQGNTFSCEGVDLRKDGSSFYIDVRGTSFLYKGKLHSLAIIQDITQRKQSAAKLMKMNEELIATNEEITALNEELMAMNKELLAVQEELNRQLDTAACREEALKLNEERLEALLKLSRMHDASQDELTDFALEEGVRLTGSKIGYLHFINDDQISLELFLWSNEVTKFCTAEKAAHYPLEKAGIWVDCVRRKQPVVHNDYQAYPHKKGYPEGHVHLKRHMSVPLFKDDKIVAVVGVGNKEEPYDDADVRQLSLLMHGMWEILELKRAEEELRQSEAKFRSLVENANDIIYTLSSEGTFTYVSPNWKDRLGHDPQEVKGKSIQEYIHPEDIPPYRNFINQVYSQGGKHGPVEYRVRHKDGTWRWHVTNASLFANEITGVKNYIGIATDITERKKVEEQLKYLSFHDKLTGLYNRAFIEEEFKRLNTKRQIPLSVIMIDVNGLKLTNDIFGHKIGDKLLKHTARVLKQACRKEDLICRWGGDEFVVLLPQTSEKEAWIISERIREKAGKEISSAMPIRLSIALGVVTRTDIEEDIERVLAQAENQMYNNKILQSKSNRNSILRALQRTMYEKTQETEQHGARLQKMVEDMSEVLNFSEYERDRLRLLAVLHDIGKIGIDECILKKTGTLTPEEYEEIKRHSEIGTRIVQAMPDLAHIAEEILSHHERWDGTGYPQGLAGKDIPLCSRILAIVEAYDVMIEGRPYQKAKSVKEAVEELRRCAGTQFDPELVEIFIKHCVKHNA